jgi:hypothetical protein
MSIVAIVAALVVVLIIYSWVTEGKEPDEAIGHEEHDPIEEQHDPIEEQRKSIERTVSRRGPKTYPSGPLHPNGSILLLLVTCVGSVLFGWMHQALWLPVPPIAFITYAVLEVGRGSVRAKREMDLTWGQIFRTWMSGLPFRGYGQFIFGNPAMGLVLFGLAWVASSLF